MIRRILLHPRGRIVAGVALASGLVWGWLIWMLDVEMPALVEEFVWPALLLGPGIAAGFGPGARALDRRVDLGRAGKASFVVMMAAMTGAIFGITARGAWMSARGWGP